VTKDAHLRITIAPVGDEDAMLFQPTVLTVEENEQLTWRGRVLIPGILDGTHSFALEETGDGGTELTHSESFRGVMLFVNDMSVYEPSFVAMNEALKVRAEAMAGAEPAAREVPSGPIQPDVGVIFNMTGGHERLSGEAVAEPEATTEEGTMEEGTSGDGAMMESTTEEGAMMEGEATMEPETPADSGSSGGSGNLFDVGRDTPSTPPMESGSNPR
jgi:hypothetical protein